MKRRIIGGLACILLLSAMPDALADQWMRIGSPQGPASAWFANLDTRTTDEQGVTRYWSVVRYRGDMVLRKEKPVGTLMLLLGDRCDQQKAAMPLGPYKAIYYDHQKKLIDQVDKPARLSWFSLLTPELSKRQHQLICAPESIKKPDALPAGQPDTAALPESGQVKRRKLILEELTKTPDTPPVIPDVPVADKSKTDQGKSDKTKPDKTKSDKDAKNTTAADTGKKK